MITGQVKYADDLVGVPQVYLVQVDENGNQRTDRQSTATNDYGQFTLIDGQVGDRILLSSIEIENKTINITDTDMTILVDGMVYDLPEAVIEGEKTPWYAQTWFKIMVGFALLAFAIYHINKP